MPRKTLASTNTSGSRMVSPECFAHGVHGLSKHAGVTRQSHTDVPLPALGMVPEEMFAGEHVDLMLQQIGLELIRGKPRIADAEPGHAGLHPRLAITQWPLELHTRELAISLQQVTHRGEIVRSAVTYILGDELENKRRDVQQDARDDWIDLIVQIAAGHERGALRVLKRP